MQSPEILQALCFAWKNFYELINWLFIFSFLNGLQIYEISEECKKTALEIENRRSELEVETCVEVKDAGSVLGGESVGIFNVQNEIAVEDEFQAMGQHAFLG